MRHLISNQTSLTISAFTLYDNDARVIDGMKVELLTPCRVELVKQAMRQMIAAEQFCVFRARKANGGESAASR
jgi:hypothetical protein